MYRNQNQYYSNDNNLPVCPYAHLFKWIGSVRISLRCNGPNFLLTSRESARPCLDRTQLEQLEQMLGWGRCCSDEYPWFGGGYQYTCRRGVWYWSHPARYSRACRFIPRSAISSVNGIDEQLNKHVLIYLDIIDLNRLIYSNHPQL